MNFHVTYSLNLPQDLLISVNRRIQPIHKPLKHLVHATRQHPLPLLCHASRPTRLLARLSILVLVHIVIREALLRCVIPCGGLGNVFRVRIDCLGRYVGGQGRRKGRYGGFRTCGDGLAGSLCRRCRAGDVQAGECVGDRAGDGAEWVGGGCIGSAECARAAEQSVAQSCIGTCGRTSKLKSRT